MRVGVASASGPERFPLSSVTSPAAATATTTASTTPTAQPARRGGTRRRRVEIGSRRVGRATTATARSADDQGQHGGHERRRRQLEGDALGQPEPARHLAEEQCQQEPDGDPCGHDRAQLEHHHPPRSRRPQAAKPAEGELGATLLDGRRGHQAEHDDGQHGELPDEERDDGSGLTLPLDDAGDEVGHGGPDGDGRDLAHPRLLHLLDRRVVRPSRPSRVTRSRSAPARRRRAGSASTPSRTSTPA